MTSWKFCSIKICRISSTFLNQRCSFQTLKSLAQGKEFQTELFSTKLYLVFNTYFSIPIDVDESFFFTFFFHSVLVDSLKFNLMLHLNQLTSIETEAKVTYIRTYIKENFSLCKTFSCLLRSFSESERNFCCFLRGLFAEVFVCFTVVARKIFPSFSVDFKQITTIER